MSIIDEFRSGNFSLYGQWCGLISIILLIIFGIFGFTPLWSIIGWVIAFLLVFIEIPLCLKCCPTSAKFDNFLIKFQNSYFRAVAYLLFAILMWVAVGRGHTWRFLPALFLTAAVASYGIAALRHQTPASSTLTGGTGVSTIV